MADSFFDGLCGVPCLVPLSKRGNYIRCKYEFGHKGEHSWKKLEEVFLRISSDCSSKIESK